MNALGLAAAWTTVAVVFAAGSAQAQVLPVGAPPLRTPEFCRALTSIIYGLRQPTAGAVLPGFTEAKLSDPNKSKPADAAKDFHAEYVFIRGHSPDMVPQRIVQCTPNGRWLSVLTRADTQEREAYQAVWILPNLTNISMGMLWAPDKGAMLSVLTFSVRPPDAAVPRPFSLSSPFAPAAPTLSPPRPTTGNPYAATAAPTPRYRCQDGREFAIEFIKGSANEISGSKAPTNRSRSRLSRRNPTVQWRTRSCASTWEARKVLIRFQRYATARF